MLSIHYLLADQPSVTGRIENGEHVSRLYATGLFPNTHYRFYFFDPSSLDTLKQEEPYSDSIGVISYDLPERFDDTTVCFMISQNGLCYLRSNLLSDKQISVCLHKIRSQHTQPLKNSQLQPLSEEKDTDVCSKCNSEPHSAHRTTVCFRKFSKNSPVDLLPILHWPAKMKEFEPYFLNASLCTSAPVPVQKYWQFVYAPSTLSNGFCLILGKCKHHGRVCALAKIIINESDSTKQSFMFPGFQKQKTPDGRSFWINISEA